jgi:hypothetical protein
MVYYNIFHFQFKLLFHYLYITVYCSYYVFHYNVCSSVNKIKIGVYMTESVVEATFPSCVCARMSARVSVCERVCVCVCVCVCVYHQSDM